MEKFFTINTRNELLLTLPEDAVLSRLGRNRYLTVIDQKLTVNLRLAMQKAFALCHARGKWKLLTVSEHTPDMVILDENWQISSRAFADFVKNAQYVFLGAVTIGSDLLQAITQAQKAGNMAEAAIFDAVGSECADLAIERLQKLAGAELCRYGLNISPQRFSAGYGGVELFHQQEIFRQLELEELGITLTETFIMQPEKSVTAFAVVNEAISNNGAIQ